MNRIHRLLQPILDPGPVPILFVAGLVLMSAIGNAVYELARNALGTAGGVGILALGILLLLLLAYAAAAWLRRRIGTRVTVSDVTPRRGLIVLVSQGDLVTIPASEAIRFHRPALQHCWLITTPKPQPDPSDATPDTLAAPSAWQNAQNLKAQLEGGVKNASDSLKIHITDVDAPNNPESIYKAIDRAYDEAQDYGLTSRDVIADLTGGTKVMTATMALACSRVGRDVEYLLPNRYLKDGRADPAAGSKPCLLDLSVVLQRKRAD